MKKLLVPVLPESDRVVIMPASVKSTAWLSAKDQQKNKFRTYDVSQLNDCRVFIINVLCVVI